MAGEKELAIRKYKQLRESKMFRTFLANMKTLVDPMKNPVMLHLLDEQQKLPHRYASVDITALPQPGSEEMRAIPTGVLLVKIKEMVDRLEQPLPQDEDALFQDSKMMGSIATLNKEFQEHRYPRNDQGEFISLPREELEKMDFHQRRVYEIAKSTADELSYVNELMFQERELEAKRETSELRLAEAKEDYTKAQDLLRYELDEFRERKLKAVQAAKDEAARKKAEDERSRALADEKEKNPQPRDLSGKIPEAYQAAPKQPEKVNVEIPKQEENPENEVFYDFGKCYINGQETKQDVVVTMTEMRQNPAFFTAQNNYLDQLVDGFEKEIKDISDHRYQVMLYNSKMTRDAIDRANNDYDLNIQMIRREYTQTEARHKILSEKLKNQKKFSDFAEYKAFQDAMANLRKEEENDEYGDDTYLVQEEYFKMLYSDEAVDAYFGDKNIDQELRRVTQQLNDLEPTFREAREKNESTYATYRSAREMAQKGDHIDEMLAEGDSEAVDQMVGLYMTLSKNRRTFNIGMIKDAAFSTKELKALQTDSLKKYNECTSDFWALESRLREGVLTKNANFKELTGQLRNIIKAENDIKNSKLYQENIRNENGFFRKNRIDSGLTEKDIDDLEKAFLRSDPKKKSEINPDMPAVVDKLNSIMGTIDQQKENLALQVKMLQTLSGKEKSNVESLLKKAAAPMDKFYKTVNEKILANNSPVKKDLRELVTESRMAREQYWSSVSNIYDALDAEIGEKVKKREDIARFRKADKADKAANKREEAVSPTDLEKLKADHEEAQRAYREQAKNYRYLKALKTSLEKGKDWYAQRSKLSNLEDQQLFHDLDTALKTRDMRLQENEEERAKDIRLEKEALQEQNQRVDENWNKAYKSLRERQDKVKAAITETAHLRRAMKGVDEKAKNMVTAKKTLDADLKAERELLRDQHGSRSNVSNRDEDRLLNDVLSSKKIGFDSPLFRKVRSEIAGYKNWKAGPGAAEVDYDTFIASSQALRDAIDNYLAERDEHKPKGTKYGQIRLDRVRALKNSLDTRANELRDFKTRYEGIQNKKAEVTVFPKTQMELHHLSNEKELKNEVFDNIKDMPALQERVLLADREPSKFTKEQKEAFAEADRVEDIKEQINQKKQEALIEMDAKSRHKEALNRFERDERVKDMNIQEYRDESVIDPKWEEIKHKYYPEDIIPVVDEFNRIMSNVPKDYGFEAYNKDRWFWQKKSFKSYISNPDLSKKMFMKDYHLQNPKPTAEQVNEINKYDQLRATVRLPEDYFGYKAYAVKFANEHVNEKGVDLDAVPMTQKEYMMKVHGVKEPYEENFRKLADEIQGKLLLEQQGVADPRTKIPNYGKIFLEDSYYKDEIQKKLQEAQAVEKRRDKIIKEIEKYDKAVSKLSPETGFEDFIRGKKYISREEYVTSGQAKLMYKLDNMKDDPRRQFGTDESKYTAEMKEKIAAFDAKVKNVDPEYGYENAIKQLREADRREYIRSGLGIETALTKKGLVDPRMKYDREICDDLVLAQLYKPEIVKDVDVQLIHMGQVYDSEYADPADYENEALQVINYNIHYKDAREYDPLSSTWSLFDPNSHDYEDKVLKDYPDDLKGAIKEYDKIMASIPADYGFDSFSKNVDCCNRFTKEQYIANGFGKKYFAQRHQMVDPRVDLKTAKAIKDYDLETANIEGKQFSRAFGEHLKQHPGASKEEFIESYGRGKYEGEREVALAEYFKGYEFKEDPRKSLPNYGRIVVQKGLYKPQPIFDDHVRLEKNAQILKEVEDYVKIWSEIDLAHGFEAFKAENKDPEQYVSKKEYMLSDRAKDLYIKEKGLSNPIVKYDADIKKDSQLRQQIREATAEALKKEKLQKEDIAKMPDAENEAEQNLIDRRETEKAKTKAYVDDKQREIRSANKQVADFTKTYLSSRQRNLKIIKGYKALGKSTSKLEASVAEMDEKYITAVREAQELQSEKTMAEFARDLRIRRYCEKMTVDDIEREEKFFRDLDNRLYPLLPWRKPLELSDDDIRFFGARQERVEQLKQERQREQDNQKNLEKLSKEMRSQNHPNLPQNNPNPQPVQNPNPGIHK